MDTPYTVASTVLAQVLDALIVCERPVAVALVTVHPVAVDSCCAGLLAVQVQRVFRTIRPFPTEALNDDQCDEQIAVTLNVSVFRCVPTVSDTGHPPSIAAQEQAAAELLDDAAIVWRVLADDAVLTDAEWERGTLAQTFTNAEGGCVGVETTVTLGLNSTVWCIECPPL